MAQITTQPTTKMQIKKAMAAAGITGELKGAGAHWEVELSSTRDKNAFMNKVCRTNVGGYQTGWGGWVLRPGYQDMGDPNDKASRWHY